MLSHRQDGYPSHRNHVPRLRSTEGSERQQTPAFGCIVPPTQRDHRHWRAGVCPTAPRASCRDRAPRHSLPPSARHGPPRTSRKARFPNVATGQFCNAHNAIKVDRRLPYARHRQNGTVPAAGRLSCQVAHTDQGKGQQQIALPHFCICGLPHCRKSVFDHFCK